MKPHLQILRVTYSPSEYIYREMIVEDDYSSIEAVLVMDNPVDRYATNGILSAVRLLDEEQSSLSDSTGVFSPAVMSVMSDSASETLTLGSIDESPM